jgi:hypothetical protein
VVIALVITRDGFPLAYEVMDIPAIAPHSAAFWTRSRRPMAKQNGCG